MSCLYQIHYVPCTKAHQIYPYWSFQLQFHFQTSCVCLMHLICEITANKYMYYLIVKFYMSYKVFFICNYFWGFGFLVFYSLVIYCLATFDLSCDWSKQSHGYLLPIRNLVYAQPEYSVCKCTDDSVLCCRRQQQWRGSATYHICVSDSIDQVINQLFNV